VTAAVVDDVEVTGVAMVVVAAVRTDGVALTMANAPIPIATAATAIAAGTFHAPFFGVDVLAAGGRCGIAAGCPAEAGAGSHAAGCHVGAAGGGGGGRGVELQDGGGGGNCSMIPPRYAGRMRDGVLVRFLLHVQLEWPAGLSGRFAARGLTVQPPV
jgi:hypothetical protein